MDLHTESNDLEKDILPDLPAGSARRSSLRIRPMLLVVLFFCFCCFCLYIASIYVETHDEIQEENEDIYSLGGRIGNSSRVIREIREGLRRHSAAITISFGYNSDIFTELNSTVEEWMEAAQQETGKPDEGDYIRWQLGGYTYKSSVSPSEDSWNYTVRIVPSYFTYYSQEEEVAEAVRKIRRSFHFLPWSGTEIRIRKIYAWLCENVSYDKVHRKNPYYHKCSTAYAALIQRTATCQGYCTAMYRLLREEGINCRIVTGTAGNEELHAWLIVEIKGKWYLLDPTWDAGSEVYQYYLLGSGECEDRTPKDVFLTEDFLQGHPMAASRYTGN